MQITRIERDGLALALVYSAEQVIRDTQSALDWMMSVQYETECRCLVLNKEAISDDFFVLSTCLAGEILQKFINYQVKLAIYGDFSSYTSKPLKDFIYESNHGKDVFFVSTEQEAIEALLHAN